MKEKNNKNKKLRTRIHQIGFNAKERDVLTYPEVLSMVRSKFRLEKEQWVNDYINGPNMTYDMVEFAIDILNKYKKD